MLFLFYFFHFVFSLGPDHFTTRQKVTSTDCNVIGCLFTGISGSESGGAIAIEDDAVFDMSIYETTFSGITAEYGSAFYVSNNVGATLEFVCFYNCSANIYGSAFIYNNQISGEHKLFTINYISISECNSPRRSIYIQGPKNAGQTFSFCHCNCSDCEFTNDNDATDIGQILFCDYFPTLSFCSFESNTAKTALIYFESTTQDGFEKSTTDTCNFVGNTITKRALFGVKYQTVTISNTIIKYNKIETSVNKLLFINGEGDLYLDSCYVDDYSYSTDPTTYPIAFYQTVGCLADFPFTTPDETPYSTPFTTPLTTPFTTPLTTPYTTPLTTPFTTPLTTPYTTPLTTPFTTPLTTPFTTPLTTPFTTPYSTPELTPFTTPLTTPELTPFSTPDSTPFNTPCITPKPSNDIEPGPDPGPEPDPDPTYDSSEASSDESHYSSIESSESSSVESQSSNGEGSEGGDGGPPTKPKGSNTTLYILIALICIALAAIAVLIILIVLRRRGRTKDAASIQSESSDNLEAILDGTFEPETATVDLFTSTGMESDPFANDFEEGIFVG